MICSAAPVSARRFLVAQASACRCRAIGGDFGGGRCARQSHQSSVLISAKSIQANEIPCAAARTPSRCLVVVADRQERGALVTRLYSPSRYRFFDHPLPNGGVGDLRSRDWRNPTVIKKSSGDQNSQVIKTHLSRQPAHVRARN
jgi:hypothetical protein